MDTDAEEFRLAEKVELRITPEEIEAQRKAQEARQQRLYREGSLTDLDPVEGADRTERIVIRRGEASRRAQDIRHGMAGDDFHIPDEEEIAAIREQDPDSAHLFELGSLKPGSAEFAAKYYPPGEEVIEVLGPKGPEGIGVVRRLRGTGPGAGEVEIPD